MKALIERDTNGRGKRDFVARLENGQILVSTDAVELVRQLRAAGVDAIEVSGSEEGDRALSATWHLGMLGSGQGLKTRKIDSGCRKVRSGPHANPMAMTTRASGPACMSPRDGKSPRSHRSGCIRC